MKTLRPRSYNATAIPLEVWSFQKKTQKDQKQKIHCKKQETRNAKDKTPIKTNMASTKPSLANNGSKKKNKSQFTCYNCGKKSKYSRNYTKLRKDLKN